MPSCRLKILPIFPCKLHNSHSSISCQMDELGRAILNLCNVVPGGVVCFFPSYEYEKRIYTHWTTTGCLDKINSKKKVMSLVAPQISV